MQDHATRYQVQGSNALQVSAPSTSPRIIAFPGPMAQRECDSMISETVSGSHDRNHRSPNQRVYQRYPYQKPYSKSDSDARISPLKSFAIIAVTTVVMIIAGIL